MTSGSLRWPTQRGRPSLPALGWTGACGAALVSVVNLELGALLGVMVIAAWVAVTQPVSVVFTLQLVLSVFSGSWDRISIAVPIGMDRICFAGGLALLAYRRSRARQGHEQFDPAATAPWPRFRAVHWAMLTVSAFAVMSALWVGTFEQRESFFALLDRLGIVPFLMFFLAPVVFATRRARYHLLLGLTLAGLYLGFTALMEFANFDALVVPKYILDPNIPRHLGRARGPFLEAVANGLAMQACAVAAFILYRRSGPRRERVLALSVVLLCTVGAFLTLTRAVWIGFGLSVFVFMVLDPRLRRFTPAIVIGSAVVIVAAFALVPSLDTRATDRAEQQQSIWDRLNTNRAAVTMIKQRPVLGFGWDKFKSVSGRYLEQSPDYPLSGVGLPVHNVFLSHTTELGFVGMSFWAAAFVLGIGGALIRRLPRQTDIWRHAYAAIVVSWIMAALFGPLGYAFPNLLLWMWGGLVFAWPAGEELRARTRGAPAYRT